MSSSAFPFGHASPFSTATLAVALLAIGYFSQPAAKAAPAPAIMTPIAVTGWNRDLVVESTAVDPPYTNYATEMNAGEGNGFYQTGLPSYAWGLPPSGLFVSMAGDGTILQFQPSRPGARTQPGQRGERRCKVSPPR